MPDFHALVRDRLASAGLTPAREMELVDELAQHLEDRYRDLIAGGATAAAALSSALREIETRGPLADIAKDRHAESVPPPPVGGPPSRVFGGMLQDLRYALRLLRQSPGFTIAAVVTVALSTGPTIAALGIANWLYVRPLPGVHDPDRLATVWFSRWGNGRASRSPIRVSYPHADALRASVRTLSGLAATERGSVTVSTAESDPTVVAAQFVSANYFDVLGVRLQAGRTFRHDEDRLPGGATVMIVSGAFARSWFGDPAAAVGRTMRLNSYTFEIVGVVDDAFQGDSITTRPSVWLTAMTSPRTAHFPPERWQYAPGRGPSADYIARLAPGATFAQAETELAAAFASIATAPETAALMKGTEATLFPGVGIDPFARPRLWDFVRLLLWVGAALVLLGVANLANLFVFRSTRRSHEAAVRRALGASPGRLARLPLLEALIIAVSGAAVGVTLTWLVRSALDGVVIPGFGRIEIPMDWRLFSMAVGVSVAVGVLLSLLPARLAARAELAPVLGRSTRSGMHAGRRIRLVLATTQVALSSALLIGALLFVGTLRNLQGVRLGFDPAGVSDLRLALQSEGYTGGRALQFQRDVLARLTAHPSIEAASLVLYAPFLGASFSRDVHLPGEDRQSSFEVVSNDITGGYFRAIGLPLVAGRTFTDDEAFAEGHERGVVVSESLARRLFGDVAAVGRTVTFPATLGNPSRDVPIIGVAADAHWLGFAKPELLLYRPIGAAGRPQSILVRSARPSAEILREVRGIVRQVDAGVPVSVGSLEGHIASRMSQQRLNAWALGVLATIGFLLAAVGIHGLVSQSVAERTREFGLRRAIGASTAQMTSLVTRQAALVLAIGLPIGLAAAYGCSRFIQSQLFGVAATSLAVYAVSAAALAAVVGLAVLGPARRALSINPVDALRD